MQIKRAELKTRVKNHDSLIDRADREAAARASQSGPVIDTPGRDQSDAITSELPL